mmetsp:Transcript_16140/g.25169  ORF Transcript_16140/g.25169 Transcript_16140/m.25169 type:complete len:211 (+) Transcript_16140:70-702(+)
MATPSIKTILLVVTNAAIAIMWARVLVTMAQLALDGVEDHEEWCQSALKPALRDAIAFSFIEILNALTGLTRSKPTSVALFVLARASIEILVGPELPCACWQHMFTGFMWSVGEINRFTCFTIDGITGGSDTAKSIRYSVGPVAFFLGTLGEVLMLIKLLFLEDPTRPLALHYFIWLNVILWPFAFMMLFKQLLKQKRKHFRTLAMKKDN